MALDPSPPVSPPPTPPSAPTPPPPRPRSSARWGWLAVPVVAVAVVPAGAWFLGQRVEAGYAERTARVVQEIPVLAKARVQYDRQLFGATRTTTLDLNAMYGNCFSASAGERRPPMVLSIVEHIQHGPFPGFRSLGAARITYDARINGQPLASYFNKPLGGADGPVLKLTGELPRPVTVVGFGQGTTTTLKGGSGSLLVTETPKAPPAPAEGEEAAPPARPSTLTLAWKAVDGRFALNGRGDKLTSSLDFEGFSVEVAGALRAAMGRLSYTADQTKNPVAGWWLASGPSSLRLDRLDVATTPAGSPGETVFSAADIVVDGRQEVASNLVSASAKGQVGSLTVLGEKLGPIEYDYGVGRLDASGWRALIGASYDPLLKGCAVPLDQKNPEEQTAETLAALKGLLLKDPEVRIDRLAVTWNGQQAGVKGRLHLAGVEAADLRAPDPSGLVPKIDAQGELRLDEGFVGVVAGAAAKRSVLSSRKAAAASGAIPPELFQRMAEAQSEAEQQAVIAEITKAQAKATTGLTDAKLLADPTVQAEIKATTAENLKKAQATRDEFLSKGLFVRDGKQLVIRGAMKNGQATINGKPAESFRGAMGGKGDGPEAAAAEAEAGLDAEAEDAGE